MPELLIVRAPSTSAGGVEQGRGEGRDVVAFMAGVEALPGGADVVVKLDADVSFGPGYFERLLGEFEADPQLGIASGTCWEQQNGAWHPYHVTGGHVRGATRAYRRRCFEDVAPLEERIGWDVVDELRAAAAGWQTRSIRELPFYHHRLLGQRDGARRQWREQGRMAHYLGYRISYLLARTLWRARVDGAAFVMLGGYTTAAWHREPRCAAELRAHVRDKQRLRRLPVRLREALGRAA